MAKLIWITGLCACDRYFSLLFGGLSCWDFGLWHWRYRGAHVTRFCWLVLWPECLFWFGYWLIWFLFCLFILCILDVFHDFGFVCYLDLDAVFGASSDADGLAAILLGGLAGHPGFWNVVGDLGLGRDDLAGCRAWKTAAEGAAFGSQGAGTLPATLALVGTEARATVDAAALGRGRAATVEARLAPRALPHFPVNLDLLHELLPLPQQLEVLSLERGGVKHVVGCQMQLLVHDNGDSATLSPPLGRGVEALVILKLVPVADEGPDGVWVEVGEGVAGRPLSQQE